MISRRGFVAGSVTLLAAPLAAAAQLEARLSLPALSRGSVRAIAMPPGFRHTVVQQRAAVDSDGEGVLTCAGKEFHNLTAILLDRRVPPTRKM